MTSADLLERGIVDVVVPDDVVATVPTIVAAVDEARPGDRLLGMDAASDRCVRGDPA